ncbi:Lrp/AsnC family transcriptional regulator [Undibacterium sp. Ren11W]|uniref:siroheme decarboxylase subunit beta n=1 Tax=Undibacterium sp. Ren11W TaxID=3413045 RepID=UPI003BF031CF
MNAPLDLRSSGSTTAFEFNLLNSFQRDFPLLARPYAALAQQLASDEASVIASLRHLQNSGAISRVGAVFRPNVLGASALAALAVPAERLAEVAAFVSARAEVNHNYEREHHYNLWFVATAATLEHLHAALHQIELACECGAVLILPMLEDFHIDLGFDLSASGQHYREQLAPNACELPAHCKQIQPLNQTEKTLLAALQHGLPLVALPFAELGVPQKFALATLQRWSQEGVIKRFGVIVRHHELGFNANAMVVWDVPDAEVSAVGQRIAASGRVTLCYRRPRQLPHWPYNLFCMIHGKDRAEVEARIGALAQACGLDHYPHTNLFSQRRFKQRGAHYMNASADQEKMKELAHG